MSTWQEERVPLPTPGRLRRELRLRSPPWWMVLALVAVVVATWVPLALIFRARGGRSPDPRVHLVLDMDQQPRRGPQASHEWFADGRAMRLPVPGTIARGQLAEDTVYRGGFRMVTDAASGASNPEFATAFPESVVVDETLVARGRERYAIYCAVCHGTGGLGDGPVNQRAIELKEPLWVPATNLMMREIRDRPDGQLVQAIRDGVRNMPAYGAQIGPRDRWAIVAWLRQLQEQSPVAEPAGGTAAVPGSAGTR